MIAMTPVLAIMVLGMLFRHQEIRLQKVEAEDELEQIQVVDDELEHDNMLVIVNRGYSERVVEVARNHGATGATILNARGTDDYQEVRLPLLHFEIQPEKEIIMFIMQTAVTDAVAHHLLQDEELAQEATIRILVSPADIMIETFSAKTSQLPD